MSCSECTFCAQSGGDVLWADTRCRVIWPNDAQYPALCRVVWNTHVKEMTDLSAPDRAHLMQVVFAVETGLRALLNPDKINVASLGNVVAHIHWHVIPRYAQDTHFPGSIWSAPQREHSCALSGTFSAQLKARLTALLAP